MPQRTVGEGTSIACHLSTEPAAPCSNQWVLRVSGPSPPHQNRPGLQAQATPPTGAHPNPLPQSPKHSPHLSGNVIGSLGRCVGYLGGYHHHLGSSWIHMGRRAGPSRRVTLHAGCTGRRLCPVLVEMLAERWDTASAGAPALSSATTALGGRHQPPHAASIGSPQGHPPPPHHPVPTHLRGRLGPPDPAHARRGPGPALPGPAAPAPGASHGRTQLAGGGSRRALHRLAVDAGTCSPAMPEPDNMWSSVFPPRPMPLNLTQLFCRARASPGAAAPAQQRVGKEGSAHASPGQGESVT